MVKLIDVDVAIERARKSDEIVGSSIWETSEVVMFLEDEPTIDAVPVVRCEKCINGIYDEANDIYKCVKSADYDPEFDDWLGFVSYHNADYYCADGERKDEGQRS